MLFFSYNNLDQSAILNFTYIGTHLYQLIDENNNYLLSPNLLIQNRINIMLSKSKYYKIDLSDEHIILFLKIQLIIYDNYSSDIYGKVHPASHKNCPLDTKNLVCNESGNVICRIPYMTDPPFCEKKNTLSPPFLCKNHGVSIFTSKKNILKIECKCSDGYFGKKCEYKYRCHNCEDKFCQQHNCNKCLIGWAGTYCQIDLTIKYCENGGIQNIDKKNHKTCNCSLGYTGKRCELNCHFILQLKMSLNLKNKFECVKNYRSPANDVKIVIYISFSLIIIVSIIFLYLSRKRSLSFNLIAKK
ncbi:hypothetical protein HZS_3232 [Henneguya salminicola]|nr:hypothetical protein HZS_3232 [Henneguya salminicola]